MSGIDQDQVYSVTRIRPTFTDAEGREHPVQGTGFFLYRGDGANGFFITNRHLLDPTFRAEGRAAWRLSSVAIEVRRYSTPPGPIRPLDETQFLNLRNLDSIVFPENDSDLAIIINPPVDPMPEGFLTRITGRLDLLADKHFLEKNSQAMDFVSFIGFPEDWYDTRANLPIARMAAIASRPDKDFHNEHISGPLVLINGMSFRGSSGSPVFSHAKGVKLPPFLGGNYVPSKILGIVAGGFRNGVEHAGLSYFVKSTEILDLLAENDFTPL